MRFASQDQTQSLTWELWEDGDAGGRAGFRGFFFCRYSVSRLKLAVSGGVSVILSLILKSPPV